MIKIYGFDITKRPDDFFEKLYNSLDAERQKKADKIKNKNAKKLSIVSYMLSKYALFSVSGVPFDEIQIKTDENGKPYAKNADFYFNVTHTGNIVLCAVSDAPVGIDAEFLRSVDLKIADKYFSNYERDYVFKHKFGQKVRFFKIWTKKEAYVKMLGTGLKDIKTFDSQYKVIKTRRYKNCVISVTNKDFPRIIKVKKLLF